MNLPACCRLSEHSLIPTFPHPHLRLHPHLGWPCRWACTCCSAGALAARLKDYRPRRDAYALTLTPTLTLTLTPSPLPSPLALTLTLTLILTLTLTLTLTLPSPPPLTPHPHPGTPFMALTRKPSGMASVPRPLTADRPQAHLPSITLTLTLTLTTLTHSPSPSPSPRRVHPDYGRLLAQFAAAAEATRVRRARC